MDFDTGSSDLFLPGVGCKQSCNGHVRYDPSTSTTSRKTGEPFNLEYGDGSSVDGFVYNDTVSIAGLRAKQQAVGVADIYSGSFGSGNFPADGLLGMGFESISVYNQSPVFQSFVAQGQATDPVFAFKLADSGSELYLGGVNKALYSGPFAYVSVVKKVELFFHSLC